MIFSNVENIGQSIHIFAKETLRNNREVGCIAQQVHKHWIKVETMSDEELASKLKQLLDGDNMKVVNDVQHREEIVSSTEDELAEGPLAEDRDGSVAAGST